ncbi:MAG: N-acetyl-gamma-glutamyl-phosphate reductase [Firmicutes bacterium]|jgi:N-acetyl-gamma-glutamyl-phosphate reductase|nr:N-acetyl-gamma-glutamyl-phosphate reductase [Bacillota bacterium]MDH7495120.1 N-acetyl-gamma-glutamyl-phosphate reductase [Bacillota bacterium]
MVRAGIAGASGYAGGELVRLLLGHAEVTIAALASRGSAGKAAFEVLPAFRGYDLPRVSDILPDELARKCDVVFMATPAGASAALAKEILAARPSVRIIDLGADFRLKNPSLYQQWYGSIHAAPELAAEAAYGLPELYREDIRAARIVANPGCYPTAALLALAPLARHGLIDPRSIIIDAKSGASGAGRTPSQGYHFPESEENLRPYGILCHRHTPEIEQELRRVASGCGVEGSDARKWGSGGGGLDLAVTFTPHVVPMSRGILVTAYSSLRAKAEFGGRPHTCGVGAAPGDSVSAQDSLTSLYEGFYSGERFVRVLRDDLPQTKAVRASNFCDVAVRVQEETGRVIAISALDNLVKGAAGQAVQNMNILFGLRESMGLENPPVWP